jgi:hypothetical protein
MSCRKTVDLCSAIQVRTQNFSFGVGVGGADPEAVYNLRVILTIVL